MWSKPQKGCYFTNYSLEHRVVAYHKHARRGHGTSKFHSNNKRYVSEAGLFRIFKTSLWFKKKQSSFRNISTHSWFVIGNQELDKYDIILDEKHPKKIICFQMQIYRNIRNLDLSKPLNMFNMFSIYRIKNYKTFSLSSLLYKTADS